MNKTAYRRYLLITLLIVMTYTNLDRQVLGLSIQDVKLELRLNDTEIGFLTGLSFALFYSVMGFPIARLADRGHRMLIIAVTTALCAVAITLCGLVQTYAELLIVRIVVAIGETGVMPTANSLIAQYFAREERPRAQAFYLLGGPLSFLLSEFGGGWMIQYHGWRATFVATGLPGLLLAILIWLGMKEPARAEIAPQEEPNSSGSVHVASRVAAEPPTLRKVLVILWRNRSFRQLVCYYAIYSFFGYGTMQWLPAYFMRSYDLQLGNLGTWLAISFGIPGLLGTYWGGRLASRYAPDSEKLQLQGVAVVTVVSGSLTTLMYFLPYHLAFLLIALSTFIGALGNAPNFAVLQTLVPEQLRAQSMALLLLIANLVGLGLGPLGIGMLSDLLRAVAGEESLRYALLILCPGNLWAAWYVWRASRTVSCDLAPASVAGEMIKRSGIPQRDTTHLTARGSR